MLSFPQNFQSKEEGAERFFANAIFISRWKLPRGENSQESAGDISASILLAETTSHDHLGHMTTPRMASAPLFPKRPLPDIWI